MRIQSLQDLHSSFPDIDGFWNLQDLQQTEYRIRMHLPKQGTGVNASEVEAMTQLARLFAIQEKFKESKELLDEVSKLLKDLKEEDRRRPEIRFYLEEGRFYCLSKFPARALESFSQAWVKASELDSKMFAIETAYMISITLPVKRGKEWLLRAIQLAESCKDRMSRSWLSRLYMLEGWQAFDSHNFEKALADFDKANMACDPGESENTSRILKWCRARSLRALGKVEKSLEIQQDLLSEMNQTGNFNGYVFLEIAECYQALQETNKAQPYFELAFENLKKNKWYTDNFDDDLTRIQKNSKSPKQQW